MMYGAWRIHPRDDSSLLPLFFFRSSSSEFRAPYIDAPVVLNLTLPQSLWEHINTHTHAREREETHPLATST